jgi:phenylacetate-coenzyme A ligase PaaK-like adenylate-forming protein
MSAATTTTAFAELRDRFQNELLTAYPESIARLKWDRGKILAHQRERLRALLAVAVERSPFHARRLAGRDLDAVTPGDLSALPVMTKPQMLDALDEVFTDRRLSRAAVETALATTRDEPVPLPGDCLAVASGGSSGLRGVFVLDVAALREYVGLLTRNLVARIDAMGGPPPGGLPLAFVAAGSPVPPTGLTAPITGTGALPFRVHAVPVTRPLHEIVDRLNALQAPLLFGYPTMLARLAREQQAGRLRIAPRAVTCTSETATPDQRARIRAGFGVPIVDTFGSSEGLAATTPPDDEVHTVAEDGCIVELVDAANRPVPPGTPSAKVLITNLYNHVQPLIRYELTDVFTAQPPAPDHGYLRVLIQGRTDEVFRYAVGDDTIELHPHIVRSVLVGESAVIEYQVRQTPHGIEVMAVCGSGLVADALTVRLTAALATAGLPDPQVRVRRLDRLRRDPQTGKLQRFVPQGS